MTDHEPLIQLVDEHDIPLRGGTMEEAQLNGEWHRIVRVMVFDVMKKLYLLQKVPKNPYYNSGHWNTSASGHVDVDEMYITAASRELEEEMGISGLTLKEVARYTTQETIGKRMYRRHNVTFLGEILSGPIMLNPNPDEVADTMWISKNELLQMSIVDKELMTGGLKRFVSIIGEELHGN